MMRTVRALILVTAAALSGCAKTPAPVVAAAPVPLPAPVYVPMPAGTYANMPVPDLLADGSYDTPNRALSAAGNIWHLRSGLNFAALGCRGAQQEAIVAGYNAMLSAQKPILAGAERTLLVEYRSTGGASGRSGYDDAMTRLYNYWSFSAARQGLCATAARVAADAATVPQAEFAEFAAARLPELDRAVTDIYRAYDAWRTQKPQVSYALAASTPVNRPVHVPWIDVDPAVLRLP